jgi:hypothetical protein
MRKTIGIKCLCKDIFVDLWWVDASFIIIDISWVDPLKVVALGIEFDASEKLRYAEILLFLVINTNMMQIDK